ncbi:MAG TPA: hypothetical protein VHC22_05880 [Pirellulales bacterium]|nr:hypothetical protein [Pirellulales bacterium]
MRYVDDRGPGIQRRKSGATFRYLAPTGRQVRDRKTLARIRSLAIPPAWECVWICPVAQGHLQATGRDARGRKQYRYHPRWREVRDETKFSHTIDFARSLPRIRRRVRRDLALRGMPREKVLATIVRLLETTLIRIGNDEYARQNGSFGLTTIRNRHVRVRGTTLHFGFRGKSGVEREVHVDDARLARIVRRCQDLPGQDLFVYVGDDGKVHDVGSGDVNEYLRAISGRDFTAKDFRTWAGTSLAVRALHGLADFDSETAAKRNINRAVEVVAEQLGNTKAVCRKCYIHPAVIESYLERTFVDALARKATRRLRGTASRLSVDEAAVLALLEGRHPGESKTARRKSPVRRKSGGG